MSYSGYTRCLCRNGHLSVYDCHDDQPDLCPHCGAPWAWELSVDTTNGPYDETLGVRIDRDEVRLDIRKPTEKCPHCGQKTGHAVYWLPLRFGRLLPGHPYFEGEREEDES